LATVAGLHVEVADLPGDSERRALVLLHEGLGSVGLWRDFPQALHAATGRRVVASSRSRWFRRSASRGGRSRRASCARLSRHHDDPDAAFHGWSDVWRACGGP
jgi:hypothetical protein